MIEALRLESRNALNSFFKANFYKKSAHESVMLLLIQTKYEFLNKSVGHMILSIAVCIFSKISYDQTKVSQYLLCIFYNS